MVSKESTAKRARARKESPGEARTERARPAAPVLDAALLSDRLCHLLHALSHSLSVVVIVSVEALQRQDADADSDIAALLQQNVGDKLDIEIEKLMQLMEFVEQHRPRVEEGAKAACGKAKTKAEKTSESEAAGTFRRQIFFAEIVR